MLLFPVAACCYCLLFHFCYYMYPLSSLSSEMNTIGNNFDGPVNNKRAYLPFIYSLKHTSMTQMYNIEMHHLLRQISEYPS